MIKFYRVDVDNNLTHEDQYSFSKYFETYADAYNFIVDETYNIKKEDIERAVAWRKRDSFNDYRILLVTIEGADYSEELVTAWVMGQFYTSTSEFESFADYISDNATALDILKNFTYHKGMPLSRVYYLIDEHNNVIMEEVEGYNEFCKRTLYNYASEEGHRYDMYIRENAFSNTLTPEQIVYFTQQRDYYDNIRLNIK